MNLKDQINNDMKQAMRAKDSARLLTIRGLLAAIKQKEVDDRVTLDNNAIIAVIDKQIKQRKDSISQFEMAQRADLVAKESLELSVLQSYLPQRLNSEQVQAQVALLLTEIQATGPADMGKAMTAAKAKLAGQADMALVSALIKQALSHSSKA
ncbi:MAG: GatB/YqeY domain-containing protein [Burkholderiales bacterium]|jgi:uncharacterized protein YqeY